MWLNPNGDVSLAAARAAFVEQIAGLAEGGVDLLIAETMMSVDEAELVVWAAREAAPHLKIAVLMTVDAAARCLDGVSVDEAAARLTSMGADAVGCNCSFGPASVGRAIERMRLATELPLVAMPSAGIPRVVEGRAVLCASAEEMGKFAHEVLRAGASWVGGCCGTTPEHIGAMRRAMDAADCGENRVAQVRALQEVA